MHNPQPLRIRIDAMAVVAIGLLIFMALNVLQDQGIFSFQTDLAQPAARMAALHAPAQASRVASSAPAASGTPPAAGAALAAGANAKPGGSTGGSGSPVSASPVGDPNAIAPPYDQFMITQGPHGFDYNQIAVDIAAGKGATIKSPINGTVTKLYIDEYNNTTLVIENDRFIVTLLHGLYTVQVGEVLQLGQPVGTESNHGYTVDAMGRLCAGRDCGYHSHWNVFDKSQGVNIYPMLLIGQ